MAQIDTLLEKLSQMNAEYATLRADEIIEVVVGGTRKQGAFLPGDKLRSFLLEILPVGLQAKWDRQGAFSFAYASPYGVFALSVTWIVGNLQLVVAPDSPPLKATSFNASSSPQSSTNASIGAPSKSSLKRFLVLLLIPLALAIGIGGMFYLQEQSKKRAQAEKLAALRQEIKKTVLEDNALVLEMLDDGALEHITYAEFFKRADRNKEARDVLIRKFRATETGPYGEQVGKFVKLMEMENEWVRAEEAVSRASLDVSSKWDTYKAANDQVEKIASDVSQARRDYEAAPYGEDYDEAAAWSYARSRYDTVSGSVKDAFDEWKRASDKWKESKRSAAVLISDWMRREPLDYPNLAPKRPVLDLLVKKKADYIGSEPTEKESSPKTKKGPAAKASIRTSTESTPTTPTRVRSTKPLDGERFPDTRMEEITADYAYNLSDEDLRYAINEMFARYGMTFRDKSYQANFEGKSWYKPDDRWKPDQIERAMTARERSNLAVLTTERSSRKSGTDDG